MSPCFGFGWLLTRYACRARPAEHHFDRTNFESVCLECCLGIHLHVMNASAVIADEVVVILGIRVKAARARSEVDLEELAHRGEVIEGLIHSAQRNARHFASCHLIEGFRCGVRGIALEQAKHQQTLRGDLESSITKRIGEFCL